MELQQNKDKYVNKQYLNPNFSEVTMTYNSMCKNGQKTFSVQKDIPG